MLEFWQSAASGQANHPFKVVNVNDGILWRNHGLGALIRNETWAWKTYTYRQLHTLRVWERLSPARYMPDLDVRGEDE